MPASPMPIRARMLLLAAALALAACDQHPDEFAPPCPRVGIPPDAADLVIYRPTGHDVTDLQLNARVQAVGGACRPGGKDKLAARLTVSFRIARGPAATSRDIDLPYFVAVTRGDQILDKADYHLRVTFPGNVDTIDIAGDPVDLLLPTPPGTTGAGYRVLAGFQLTPAELEQNRQRGPE